MSELDIALEVLCKVLWFGKPLVYDRLISTVELADVIGKVECRAVVSAWSLYSHDDLLSYIVPHRRPSCQLRV